MSILPTPHNAAVEGEIAKTVLMPGDPLRAKMIADNYLTDVKCFNTVRNMLGYTGKYNGKEVSVMGHGMGIPSIGIYSYELYNFYGVDNIIRVGSAGSISDKAGIMDVVLASAASTNSNYAAQYKLPGIYAPVADFELMLKAYEEAKKLNITPIVGNVLSSDTFYCADEEANDKWRSMGVIAIEMEAAALYMNAAKAGKRALCILTISDDIYKKTELTAEERQKNFGQMIQIALNTL